MSLIREPVSSSGKEAEFQLLSVAASPLGEEPAEIDGDVSSSKTDLPPHLRR